MMTKQQYICFFQFSAVFNAAVALTLLFAADLFIDIIELGAYTSQPIFMHLFAIVVLAFGGLYYYISKNIETSRVAINFGMYAKLGVVAVCVIDTLLGLTVWTINIPAFVDLICAIIFYRALKSEHVN